MDEMTEHNRQEMPKDAGHTHQQSDGVKAKGSEDHHDRQDRHDGAKRSEDHRAKRDRQDMPEDARHNRDHKPRALSPAALAAGAGRGEPQLASRSLVEPIYQTAVYEFPDVATADAVQDG